MTVLMLKRMADGRWVLIKEGVTTPVREFQILTPHRVIGFGERPPTEPQKPPHAYEAMLTDDSDPQDSEWRTFPKEWQNVSGDWV